MQGCRTQPPPHALVVVPKASQMGGKGKGGQIHGGGHSGAGGGHSSRRSCGDGRSNSTFSPRDRYRDDEMHGGHDGDDDDRHRDQETGQGGRVKKCSQEYQKKCREECFSKHNKNLSVKKSVWKSTFRTHGRNHECQKKCR